MDRTSFSTLGNMEYSEQVKGGTRMKAWVQDAYCCCTKYLQLVCEGCIGRNVVVATNHNLTVWPGTYSTSGPTVSS